MVSRGATLDVGRHSTGQSRLHGVRLGPFTLAPPPPPWMVWTVGGLLFFAGCGMGIETRNGASVVSPATGPEDSADVALREAAHHLIEREFPEGKARVEYALSQHPGDPRGTFLLACIALEEKAWPEFDEAVAELNARLPDAPEVAMLAALAK